jgi:hypothetical protein
MEYVHLPRKYWIERVALYVLVCFVHIICRGCLTRSSFPCANYLSSCFKIRSLCNVIVRPSTEFRFPRFAANLQGISLVHFCFFPSFCIDMKTFGSGATGCLGLWVLSLGSLAG